MFGLKKLFRTGWTPTELKWITEDAHFSPDLAKLEEYEYQWVFAPDLLQEKLPEHHFIEDHKPYKGKRPPTGYTRDVFKFYRKRSDNSLIPLLSSRSDTDGEVRSSFSCPIKGQLFAIRPWQFKGLDFQRRNGVWFNRRRIQIAVPYREVLDLPEPKPKTNADGRKYIPIALQGKQGLLTPERVHLVPAWMYIGNPDFWGDVIDSGYAFTPVGRYQSRRPWLRQYYSYTLYEHENQNN